MSTSEQGTTESPAAIHVHIRRLRRTDFVDAMRLLADAGLSVPAPDRRTLRRFRHIVADLGSDVYISLVDGAFAGLIHLIYGRQLTTAPRAQIEMLVVAPAFRRRGVGRALLQFALGRAAKRQCSRVDCHLPAGDVAASRLLASAGFDGSGGTYVLVARRSEGV